MKLLPLRNFEHHKRKRPTFSGGDKPARDCGRLVRSQSLDLIPFMRDVRRGMKSFAVGLP